MLTAVLAVGLNRGVFMLFLGHFSFDERKDDGRFGHFTCVVEAKTTGAAEKAFNKLIRSIKREKKLFTGTMGVPIEIYLDSLNEIADVPVSGVVSWYSCYGPDGLGSISTALPHTCAASATPCPPSTGR